MEFKLLNFAKEQSQLLNLTHKKLHRLVRNLICASCHNLGGDDGGVVVTPIDALAASQAIIAFFISDHTSTINLNLFVTTIKFVSFLI